MSQTPEVEARSEVRDGMRITWHQPIEMDDGIVLRADVHRPVGDGRYPVILSYGVYAKDQIFDHGPAGEGGGGLQDRVSRGGPWTEFGGGGHRRRRRSGRVLVVLRPAEVLMSGEQK